MGKKITGEQVISTTLELIKAKEGLSQVNLREIARQLGCAHTNLYNYFSSLEEVLWRAHQEVQLRLLNYVTDNLENIQTNLRLEYISARFIEFYLENKGWFKLLWFEKFDQDRPKENIEITVKVVDAFIDILSETYGNQITKEDCRYILHTVHCYLNGEISIYISGRGLIKDETEFKTYVSKESLKMTNLLVSNITKINGIHLY